MIENDYLEGIVALPDQLFYNTGISTYFWILTNRKTPDRRGKIVLVDARESWAKMRKSLGDKRKYIPDEAIAEVTRLYADALDHADTDKRVKVFNREDFGYQRVTVEQPKRRRWEITEDAIDSPRPLEALDRLVRTTQGAPAWPLPPRDRDVPVKSSRGAAGEARLAHHRRAVLRRGCYPRRRMGRPRQGHQGARQACRDPDPDGPVITNRRGEPEPDPDLRDQENIPLPAGWLDLPPQEQTRALIEQAEQHLETEIRPYAPDAWIDHTKTRIGYEIPFTRHFYEYIPPRPLEEIDAELAGDRAAHPRTPRRARPMTVACRPWSRYRRDRRHVALEDESGPVRPATYIRRSTGTYGVHPSSSTDHNFSKAPAESSRSAAVPPRATSIVNKTQA